MRTPIHTPMRAYTCETSLMNAGLTRAELARYIDHTLLAPEATEEDVERLYREASELGVFSICVSPNMLPERKAVSPKLCTVIGFPSGKHLSSVKADEAAKAVADGADELDMVIDIGKLKAQGFDAVRDDIAAVRNAAPVPILLKVIIESAALTDEQILTACAAAEAAGADFVKTSTGFHKAGGASVAAVRLMRQAVGDRLGVKASGGVRTYEDAVAMISAGASRLGMSSSAEVLASAPIE